MSKYSNDLYGQKFQVIGTVVEHLRYSQKEWVTLQLEDGSSFTINVKLCKKVDAP